MDAARHSALLARQPRTIELLREAGILPILTVDSVEQARELAEALMAGGLRAVELTLRTPVAFAAISALKQHYPGLRVGAGTVLTAEHLSAAEAAGADFIITPGATPALLDALAATLLPVVVGASTPSEMLALREQGFRVAKFFPAAVLGGSAMLQTLRGPLPDFTFCPTGGLLEADAAAYLALPNVACIGGSWMLDADLLETTRRARRCRDIVDARRV